MRTLTKAASGSSPVSASSHLTKPFRLLFTSYLVCAILYTSWSYVLVPTATAVKQRLAPRPHTTPGDLEAALIRASKISEHRADLLWHNAPKNKKAAQAAAAKAAADAEKNYKSGAAAKSYRQAALDGIEWGVDMMHWHSPKPVHGLDSSINTSPVPMSEDLFLSKAFGEALQPSKIIPYYYRATTSFEKEDITITTLVTSNRLKALTKLAEHYQGPISATIHVTNNPLTRTELLDALNELYTSSPYLSAYVDVHLVVDTFDRQFNMWRNVAKFFARTDYVMMLDVDFWICTDFRSRLLGSPEIMEKLRGGLAAFVVPAFEFIDQKDGLDAATFPSTKPDLLSLVKAKKIDMFHKAWVPGHGSTNYSRYYDAKPSEVYRVRTYQHSYEPYVIFKKEGTPFCDERFIGYGANKAACLFELYLSGVSYYVLPDDFLIHQSHAYAEKARKHERRYNRKLYMDFREELCFRYLNQFIERGELQNRRSRNLLIECKKIKGFSAAAGRLIAYASPHTTLP